MQDKPIDHTPLFVALGQKDGSYAIGIQFKHDVKAMFNVNVSFAQVLQIQQSILDAKKESARIERELEQIDA